MSSFIVKVDNRESELLNQIKTLDPLLNVQCIQLPIGDIIISDEKEDIIIIERKTVQDLQASIRDGRYEEQSYRLNGLSHHNHNIIYLIEGDLNKLNKFVKVDKQALCSAMFSLNFYKGFSLYRTTSIEETSFVICNMVHKLEKTKDTRKPFYSNTSSIQEPNQQQLQDDKSYIGFAKKVKKDNITQENIGEIMLCQIPGISSVTALAIMEKFKSISNLIKEINENSDCLKDISYKTEKGQMRKVSSSCLTNIVKYLCDK